MAIPALLPLALGTLGVIAGQLEPPVKLWTEPAVLVVKHGGSVKVKLRVNCSGSEPSKSGIPDMETSIRKEEVSKEPGEKVLRLVNVTEWTSNNIIYHTCPNRTRTWNTIPVVVYSIPAPKLTPSRPDMWDLSCSVSGTAPLGNVTVTLRSGCRVLASQTLEAGGRTQPDIVRLDHRLPVRPEDDGKNVTCEALLDVSPHGGPANVTSEPLTLDLTALPEGPLLSPPPHAELGTPFDVHCIVRPGSPAAEFTVTADNRTFPVTLTQLGHQAIAAVTLNRTGEVRLDCAVRVGGVERTTNATVHVYHVPTPWLNVNTTAPAAGAAVSGQCALPPNATADTNLRVLTGAGVLRDWGRSPMAFEVPGGEEGTEVELSCQAKLLDTVRNISVLITVRGEDPIPLLPVLLGTLLPALALLGLAGLYVLHHHRTKIGEYWLWGRQPDVGMRLLRSPDGPKAASAPNGSAAKAR